MKCVNRDDFMKLPAGTIYAKGEPWAFGGLCIKADSLETDWVCLDPAMVESHDPSEMDDRLTDMLVNGASYPMVSSFGRDGYFNMDDIFLVLEKNDLLVLQEYVSQAIAVSE